MSNRLLTYLPRLRRGAAALGLAGSVRLLTGRILAAGGAIEIAITFSGAAAPGGIAFLGAAILGSFLTLWSMPLPFARSGFRGKTPVTIGPGNVLTAPVTTHVAFGVNERFDAAIGDRVAPDTLHGRAITEFYGGDEARFRREVDSDLAAQGIAPRTPEPPGERPAYPIGTTAVLEHGARRLFAVALVHTDLATHLASADVDDLWTAMLSLWRKVREKSNGRPIVIPLFGSGLARVPVEPQTLLDLILASIEHESAQSPITHGGISVLLFGDVYDRVDLGGAILH